MLNPEIFRQYDIRGIAGKDMTEEDVKQLGRGIATYLAQQGFSNVINLRGGILGWARSGYRLELRKAS